MNVLYQAREHKDPYIHDVKQEEMYSHGVGQEVPGIAQQLVTQGKKIYTLVLVGESWWLYKNDGSAPAIIVGDYTPDFRVRYMKCWGASQQGVDYENVQLVFDIPQSVNVMDRWAVGVMHKIWITRLHLGEREFAAQEVSLIG